MNHNKYLTKQNIKYLFKTLDANDDGMIDISEFKLALPSNHKDT